MDLITELLERLYVIKTAAEVLNDADADKKEIADMIGRNVARALRIMDVPDILAMIRARRETEARRVAHVFRSNS